MSSNDLIPWVIETDNTVIRALAFYQCGRRCNEVLRGIYALIIGNLSKDVFERRTSTGSEAFFLFICLDAIKICIANFLFSFNDDLPESFNQTTAQWCKSPLPVDVRRSETLLLKVPNMRKIFYVKSGS